MWPDFMPGDPEIGGIGRIGRRYERDDDKFDPFAEPPWFFIPRQDDYRERRWDPYRMSPTVPKGDKPIRGVLERLRNLFEGNGPVTDEQLLSNIRDQFIPYLRKYIESVQNNGSPLTYEEFLKGGDLLLQYHVLNAVTNLDDALAEIAKEIIQNPNTSTGLVLICVATGQFELLVVPTCLSVYNNGRSMVNAFNGDENWTTVTIQGVGIVIGAVYNPVLGEAINRSSIIFSTKKK
jgi:hypothetical protein